MGNKKFLPIVVAALLAVALVVPAAVLGAPEALATRTLPASVDPGADFGVGIETSGCGAFGQVVETLPTGFSYVGTDSTDVNVTPEDNTVKFTFMADAVSFTYTVKASTTPGVYIFSGVVKDEYKVEYAIGDTEIAVTVAHPELESSGLTKAAIFTSRDLSISPSEVNIGEEVTISVLVTNTGSASGSYRVTLKIDGPAGGYWEATKEVTLNAGASKEVTFTTAKDAAGSCSVAVNGLSGSFSIREKPAPPPPPPEEVPPVEVNWPVVGGIIAGVVIVGLLIFFLARRRAA